jgi:hypothetical protein
MVLCTYRCCAEKLSLDQPATAPVASGSNNQSSSSSTISSSDIDITEPLLINTNKALFFSSQAYYHDPPMDLQSIESHHAASAMLSCQSSYATAMVSDNSLETKMTRNGKSRRTDHLFKSRYRDLDKLKSSSAVVIPIPTATIPRDMLPTRESSRELSSFIYRMCRYSNLVDASGLSKLVSSTMNDQALIRIRTKMFTLNTTGSIFLVSINMNMAEKYPDGILRVLSMKCYRDSHGVRKIKARIVLSATKVLDDVLPEGRPGLPENHSGKYTIADTIDEQVSNSVKEEVRRREMDYKRQQKSHLLTVEYESISVLTIDSFSNKIAIFESQTKLISFAGKPLHEIAATI